MVPEFHLPFGPTWSPRALQPGAVKDLSLITLAPQLKKKKKKAENRLCLLRVLRE